MTDKMMTLEPCPTCGAPCNRVETPVAFDFPRESYHYAGPPSQPSAAGVPDDLDYVPGELDRTAPARIWLQIDTVASSNDREEPWPRCDGVTWQDESIGGLEIQYVRADLVVPMLASARVPELENALRMCVSANAMLSEIEDGKTLYEGSPTHSTICLLAWSNLNTAIANAKQVLAAAPKPETEE